MKKIFCLLVAVTLGVFAGDLDGVSKGEPAVAHDDKVVAKGSHVKVHYTGTLEDGTKFDSSYDRGEPLSFEAGVGQMIKGFDAEVIGMKVGETKKFTVAAEDAYGERRDALVFTANKDQFPEGNLPSVGDKFQAAIPETRFAHVAVVTKVEGDSVTLDANHELAGKDLTFEIEIVELS